MIALQTKFLLFAFLFIHIFGYSQRQSKLKTEGDVIGYNLMPAEKLFIHYNSSLLFAGEYLYYKLYCVNTNNKQLSRLSKLAYVRLINQEGISVYDQKILLNKGTGQGDFFVPVSIPSGSYKLIAYTQWMLNRGDSYFFKGDLNIVNPYQSNSEEITASKDSNSVLINSIKGIDELKEKETKVAKILISIDDTIYSKRSRVQLKVENRYNESIHYSVSVRKKSGFAKAIKLSAEDYSGHYPEVSAPQKELGDFVFLPEMRGELIYGKIIPKKSGISVSDVNIAISVPGRTSNINIISTNKNGGFIFTQEAEYKEGGIHLQVLGDNKNDYSLHIEDIPEINLENLEWHELKLTSGLKEEILNRSIHNQIDNSFFNVKPDTIPEASRGASFYGEGITNYDLDEYTRFPTVKESIIEIVDGVWIRKTNKGSFVFAIQSNYPGQKDDNLLPLVLVDGLVIQDHEEVINFDARNVKSIGFIRNQYYLGSKTYDGVLVVKTINTDFHKNSKNSSTAVSKLIPPLREKRYFKQTYDKEKKYDRLPDYRHQLLWQPKIKTNKNSEKIIDFFTSDVVGDYEISVEGFTNNGTPISIKKNFKVRQAQATGIMR
ncbi:hypothetical protein U6A24_11720 [Aquimarina gracilis]|uniref:MG2 domain-containing protein n=1 Tax=Aquimarina gracilis TaxID=874422 RepID=A0ABU5ZW84_9FLAO|nr:hypothetical protein [Aquimarina gracilis]MEB3346134.1 hypothetical protein [Aquimarina gracilis]